MGPPPAITTPGFHLPNRLCSGAAQARLAACASWRRPSLCGSRKSTMQGITVRRKNGTAPAPIRPNVPGPKSPAEKLSTMERPGTSAATPQSPAAALWLAEHWDRVKQYSQPWMRVDSGSLRSVRSAQKFTDKMSASETKEKSARACCGGRALAIKPPAEAELRKLPRRRPRVLAQHDFWRRSQFCNWRRTVDATSENARA